MGTSTNGQLSFGVCFKEGFEFPWDAEPYEGDYKTWWRDVRGFKNPVDSPYTETGEYKPGVTKDSPVIDEYFKAQREWDKANPFPVEVVNYCSGEYPMWMLATKHISNRRGYPEAVDLAALIDTKAALSTLMDFMAEFKIECEESPKWWLSSYWG